MKWRWARTNSKKLLSVEFSSHLISLSGYIPFSNYTPRKHAKFICWKVLSLFSQFIFPLLICISVYGKEHNNYEQQTIHLWREMDSVAYLVSLNINRRMTSGRCCWIDDCNWWTPIDAFIHDQACVWRAVLKYLPHLNSFTQPMPDSNRPMRKRQLLC